jgi:hypothetical protein
MFEDLARAIGCISHMTGLGPLTCNMARQVSIRVASPARRGRYGGRETCLQISFASRDTGGMYMCRAYTK